LKQETSSAIGDGPQHLDIEMSVLNRRNQPLDNPTF